jgi:hypothetical protein
MAKERTYKSKYPSRYSPGGYITAPQYIVELCCEKKGKLEKKDLPTQFWQLPEWQKFYKSQIHTANTLVKKHGEAAVIAALKNPKSAWMYSLRAPGFEGLILEERRLLKLQEQKPQSIENYDAIDIKAPPIENFRSAYLSDKLRDL